MSFNSSRSVLNETDRYCFFKDPPNILNNSTYYAVTFATCVITAALSPLVVAGNSLILAAIWRNPSLRTPSYVMLGGLAFTDFCTGLVSQPFYVVYKLGELTDNKQMYCIAGAVTEGVGLFFSSLTVVAILLIAVERWLFMSRRSLLTVRRIIIIYFLYMLYLMIVLGDRLYHLYQDVSFSIVGACYLFTAGITFIGIALAYYKVYRIIRRHQMGIHAQPNQTAINVAKYKKSSFTILYILALFLLSYAPYLVCMVVFSILQDYGKSTMAAFNACTTVVFTSSLLNPLLYYWRMKEIKDDVKAIVKKLLRKQGCS